MPFRAVSVENGTENGRFRRSVTRPVLTGTEHGTEGDQHGTEYDMGSFRESNVPDCLLRFLAV